MRAYPKRRYYAEAADVEQGRGVEGWHIETLKSGWLSYSLPFLFRREAEALMAHPGMGHLRGYQRVVPVAVHTVKGQPVRVGPGKLTLQDRVIRGLRAFGGGQHDGLPPHYAGYAYGQGCWYIVWKPQAEAAAFQHWEVLQLLHRYDYAPPRGAEFSRLLDGLLEAGR